MRQATFSGVTEVKNHSNIKNIKVALFLRFNVGASHGPLKKNIMFMQSALFEVYCEIVFDLLKTVCQVYLEPILIGTSPVFFVFFCAFRGKNLPGSQTE